MAASQLREFSQAPWMSMTVFHIAANLTDASGTEQGDNADFRQHRAAEEEYIDPDPCP
jgi:hypothetical protein